MLGCCQAFSSATGFFPTLTVTIRKGQIRLSLFNYVMAVHHPQPQITNDMSSAAHSFQVAFDAAQATPMLEQSDTHEYVSKKAVSVLCSLSGDLGTDTSRSTHNDSRIASFKFLWSLSPMAGFQLEPRVETSVGGSACWPSLHRWDLDCHFFLNRFCNCMPL